MPLLSHFPFVWCLDYFQVSKRVIFSVFHFYYSDSNLQLKTTITTKKNHGISEVKACSPSPPSYVHFPHSSSIYMTILFSKVIFKGWYGSFWHKLYQECSSNMIYTWSQISVKHKGSLVHKECTVITFLFPSPKEK